MKLGVASKIIVIALFSFVPQTLALQGNGPLRTFAGDGLTLVVLSDVEGLVSGEIRRGNDVFPFTAAAERPGGAELLVGSFSAGGTSFDFRATRQENDPQLTLTTGQKTYNLKLVSGGKNPLAQNDSARPVNPLANGAGAATPAAPAAADQLKLKTVEFRDVSMGGVIAERMLIPEDWTAEGRIEWSQGTVVFPNRFITAKSPDGCMVMFTPTFRYAYTETDPSFIAQMQQIGAGADLQPQQGTPPPQDVGQFIVEMLRGSNSRGQNLRLVDQEPDRAAERFMENVRQQLNIPRTGMQESWVILTLNYEVGGVTIREELNVAVAVFEPLVTQASRMTTWSLIANKIIAAPQDQFEKKKPLLNLIAGSLGPTPKWWTQKEAALLDISRQRHELAMQIIKSYAPRYDTMSSSQHDAFKERMASMDRIQERTLDTISEVDKYRDRDGGAVKLPIHYQHVWADEKGNYLLSNNSLHKPLGDWQELNKLP